MVKVITAVIITMKIITVEGTVLIDMSITFASMIYTVRTSLLNSMNNAVKAKPMVQARRSMVLPKC